MCTAMQAHWHDFGISSAMVRTSCQGTPLQEHKAKEGDREKDRKESTADPTGVTLIPKGSTPVTQGCPRRAHKLKALLLFNVTTLGTKSPTYEPSETNTSTSQHVQCEVFGLHFVKDYLNFETELLL